MARVTDADLRKVIDIPTSTDTSVFIGVANRYVDAHLLPEGLTEAELTDIELFLAAHFAALTVERGGLTSEKIGDTEESYANVYKAGIHSTRYGQAAIALDTTGKLASMGSGNLKAEFKVV